MKRYLIFDSGCSTCSSLAQSIEKAAAEKLDLIGVTSERAKELLDSEFPNGWKYQPYLVSVSKEGKVSVLTGRKMALQLGMLLGLREGWRVYALAKKYGVKITSGRESYSFGKRKFLRNSTIFGGALLGVGSGFPNFGALLAQDSRGNYDPKSRLSLWSQDAARELSSTVMDSKDYNQFKPELGSGSVLGEAVVFSRGSDAMFVSVPIAYPGQSKSAAFTRVITQNQSAQGSTMSSFEDTPAGHRGRFWHNSKLMMDITVNDQGIVISDELFKAGLNQSSMLGQGQNFLAQGRAAVDEFVRQLSENSAPQSSSFLDSSKASAVSISCVNRCLASQGIAGYALVLIGAACSVACAGTAGLACYPCIGAIVGGAGGTIAACISNCRGT
jgi:hypothetical protein